MQISPKLAPASLACSPPKVLYMLPEGRLTQIWGSPVDVVVVFIAVDVDVVVTLASVAIFVIAILAVACAVFVVPFIRLLLPLADAVSDACRIIFLLPVMTALSPFRMHFPFFRFRLLFVFTCDMKPPLFKENSRQH